MKRAIDLYKTTIREAFCFLKQTNSLETLWAKSISLGAENGVLLPICKLHLEDNGLIEQITQWRNENNFAYPTQFMATFSGTEKWLEEQVIMKEDRILFLVLNKIGQLIGHIGLANCINEEFAVEIDNVVRGVSLLSKGIMTAALKSLIKWAKEELLADSIFLRVFDDNAHAVNFYKKNNFIEDKKIPLYCKKEENRITYSSEFCDQKKPDKFFLKMVYKPEEIKTKPQTTLLTAGPLITGREASYVLDAVKTGWNNHWADYIKKFEAEFAKYLGVKYAITTSCCTGALHLSLLALGIGAGDEVIVPDITWVATANAVLYTGATPVFADIEKDSWCLDPKSFESLITKKTKAVMPVHLYGHPARMDEIMKIAKEHKLFVVEDAAPAIGAAWQGRKTGTFGDFGCFSFQGAKLLVTGEGGMLVTNNEALYKRVYPIWDQGRTPGTFWINELGWKYKMSNIQAALGLGQLERITDLITAKRRIFSWYYNELKDVSYIKLNYEIDGAESIYWMTSIILLDNAPIKRDEVIKLLKEFNIDTRPVFPAISQYPYWPKKQKPMAVANWIGNNGINLPSGVCLKREEVVYICNCLKKILQWQ